MSANRWRLIRLGYRWGLAVFPRGFRRDHGAEMYRVLCLRLAAVDEAGRRRAVARLAARECVDLARTALRLHWRALGRRLGMAVVHRRTDSGGEGAHRVGTSVGPGGGGARDLRFALRQLRAHPGFAIVAITTLGIGIGAATTIFSVVDHLMLRDLPFPESSRIVTVWQDMRADHNPMGEVAPANFLDWKERNRTLIALGAAEPYSFDLTGRGRPVVLRGSLVTEGFFEALGAKAFMGRLFLPDDYIRQGGAVVVVGHGLWRQQFGGDPGIVGRSIVLDGDPVTVVGVLQQDFDLGLRAGGLRRELWMPRRWSTWEKTSRSSAWWQVVGRLAPGVTVAQARADLDRVAEGLATEFPTSNADVGVTVVPLRDYLVGASRTTLLVLFGAVAMVLLLACVNVANLLLARGTAREREYVLRAALGAGRGALIRQTLIESGVIAAMGAALGAGLAFAAVMVVKAIAPGTIPRFDTVAVDLRVLGFAVGLAAVTALAFGFLPAWQLSRAEAREVLAEGRATIGRRSLRLREGLIVVEAALALTLLAGAGLLLRSFAAVTAEDTGFPRDRLAALQLFYYEPNQTPADRVAFFQRTIARIGALPGVQAVGAVSAAPFAAADLDTRRTFRMADRPAPRAGEEPQTYVAIATPGYFGAMGIPLLRGRLLAGTDDADAPQVLIINEALRHRYYPDRDPIGRQLLLGEDGEPATIVGVVGDTRQTGLDVPPRPQVFLPHAQVGSGSMTYFVRTAGDPGPLLPAMQEAVWAEAPLQTFYQVATMDGMIEGTLVARRFSLSLVSVFAAIGLLLAAIGVYGVVSANVTHRTREFGIRMALGADRGAVARLVLGRGLGLTVAGVVIGGAAFFLTSPVVADLLYQVAPRDLAALALGAAILLTTSVLASWLPARRATRLHPMAALRHE